MAPPVSKDCFPAPSECHNCMRKRSSLVKTEPDAKKDYKRCSNCHLMTYCDADCQREHWLKVHKKHCRFLSGKARVNSSNHDPATCSRCIEQNQTSLPQIKSENSPKTVCYTEQVIVTMKKALNKIFGFHTEGKKCHCSLEYACELPFPLGEISGQYVEIASTGLDAMMAHALNILTAMNYKVKKEDNNIKDVIIELWRSIIFSRSVLWYDILVRKMPLYRPRTHLADQADSLGNFFAASSPWWKALKFTMNFVVKTSLELESIYIDSRSLEYSRFQTFKLIEDYQKLQLQNQAVVSEKQMWSNFMLCPVLVDGSLTLLLPPGTRCQSCSAELFGEVAISNKESNSDTLSCLFSGVGDNGALVASCPVAKNQKCRIDCHIKNVISQVRSNKDQKDEFLKENELFYIESRSCDICLKSSLSSHRCSSCLTVQYCSIDCQKEDKDFHMTVCATWAKDKSRRILGKEKQKDHWKAFFEQ